MRLFFLLWVALLSFGLPEVFAGTGKGWLTRPDVYILALPLYTLHFLLLCHIAVKTRRTSWPALYLFGVLFGLYESWITKVIWSGYPGSDGFAFGSFGQWFGVHETLGLVLFYHPVTSFLLPLAVVTRLFPAFGQHFPAPDWVFGTGKWALARRVVLVALWGLISGHNMPEVSAYSYSWVPMIMLLWLGYMILKPRAHTAVAQPVLGHFGLWVSSIWLALIYVTTYFLLLPERLPPAYIQGITLLLYVILLWLLWKAPPCAAVPCAAPLSAARNMPLASLLAVFLVGLVASAGIGAGIAPAVWVGVTPFLAMVLIGVGLFVWLVVWQAVIKQQR